MVYSIRHKKKSDFLTTWAMNIIVTQSSGLMTYYIVAL